MMKEQCITKEKHDEMYKTNEESNERKDLSVEEDLESFIERIKTGKINYKETHYKGTILEKIDEAETFSLCLLDKEKRKKLEQKDEEFMKTFYHHESHHDFYRKKYYGDVDVPEAEWKASESNLKFAKSVCFRETYLIDA